MNQILPLTEKSQTSARQSAVGAGVRPRAIASIGLPATAHAENGAALVDDLRSAFGKRHVHAPPLRDARGTMVKWYGSSTEIGDHKRAAEALCESERQWREVFEHNPAIYFMIDTTGTILSVNASGAAQLGYTVNELVGQ